MKLGSARPLFMKFEGKVNWDSPVPTILTLDPFRLWSINLNTPKYSKILRADSKHPFHACRRTCCHTWLCYDLLCHCLHCRSQLHCHVLHKRLYICCVCQQWYCLLAGLPSLMSVHSPYSQGVVTEQRWMKCARWVWWPQWPELRWVGGWTGLSEIVT